VTTLLPTVSEPTAPTGYQQTTVGSFDEAAPTAARLEAAPTDINRRDRKLGPLAAESSVRFAAR
jgi:hypothetical protein